MSACLYGTTPGRHRAVVEATEVGILAGMGLLTTDGLSAPSGHWQIVAHDGASLVPGTLLVEVTGSAVEMVVAEDHILGPLGYASGVATRAARFRSACPDGLSLACGGWKKLPNAMKPLLRAGIATAGILPRLLPGEFVYVGKNGVRLLGGVDEAVARARALNHGPVSIQVATASEAMVAVNAGAGVIMVDTGRVDDLDQINQALISAGVRHQITLAFGGGVRLEQLADIRDAGAETVDIGRAILDAPLLDLRFRVVQSS